MLVPAFTATLNAAFQSEQVPKEYNGGLITLRDNLWGCPIDGPLVGPRKYRAEDEHKGLGDADDHGQRGKEPASSTQKPL